MSSPSEPVETVSISIDLSFLPSFMIEPLPKARSIWVSAASRALDLSMDELSTTRSAAVISRSIWLTNSAARQALPGPAKADRRYVHYLFSVRNMFLYGDWVLVPFDPHWSLLRIAVVPFRHHSYRSSRSLWSLIGAHAVPSVPQGINENPFVRRAALRRPASSRGYDKLICPIREKQHGSGQLYWNLQRGYRQPLSDRRTRGTGDHRQEQQVEYQRPQVRRGLPRRQ